VNGCEGNRHWGFFFSVRLQYHGTHHAGLADPESVARRSKSYRRCVLREKDSESAPTSFHDEARHASKKAPTQAKTSQPKEQQQRQNHDALGEQAKRKLATQKQGASKRQDSEGRAAQQGTALINLASKITAKQHER